MSKQFNAVTFNTQRNFSGGVIQSIRNISRRYRDAVLLLQEVTPEMEMVLRGEPGTSLHAGENMIIVPPQYRLISHGSFQFGPKTFLIADVQSDDVSVRCVTGKLPHGFMSSVRRKTLETLLVTHHMDTSLLALDTNLLYPFERNTFTNLLKQYGFSATSNTRGTHSLDRLEPASLIHRLLRLYGRLSGRRKELDFLVHSDDIVLKKTHVLPWVKTSDHEAVYGSFIVPTK